MTAPGTYLASRRAAVAAVAAAQENRPSYWRTWRGRRRTSLGGGDAVHRDRCPVIPRERVATPWREMDGQPEAAVREQTALDDLLHLCAVCFGTTPALPGATMTELAINLPAAQPLSFDQQLVFAEKMADATSLPNAYRKQPGNLLFAAQMADMLGLHPLTVIRYFDFVEGRLSPGADAQSFLVRRAGHRIDIWSEGEGPLLKGICEITRGDNGKSRRVEFSHDDAAKAGLLNKDTYKKWERRMLKHRAVTEAVQDVCVEVLMGAPTTFTPTPSMLGVEAQDDDIADAEVIPEQEGDRVPEGNRTPVALRSSIWQHAHRLWPSIVADDDLMAEVEGEFAQMFEGTALRNATPAELQAFEADLANRHPVVTQ